MTRFVGEDVIPILRNGRCPPMSGCSLEVIGSSSMGWLMSSSSYCSSSSSWVNYSSSSLYVSSSSWDHLCCSSSIFVLSSSSTSCLSSNSFCFMLSSSSSSSYYSSSPSLLSGSVCVAPMFNGPTFHFLLLSPDEYLIIFLGANFFTWGVVSSSSSCSYSYNS